MPILSALDICRAELIKAREELSEAREHVRQLQEELLQRGGATEIDNLPLRPAAKVLIASMRAGIERWDRLAFILGEMHGKSLQKQNVATAICLTRSALRALGYEGWIETRPGTGYRLSEKGRADLDALAAALTICRD